MPVGDIVLYPCVFLYQQPEFLKPDQNNLRSHFTRLKNLFPNLITWFSYGHFPVVSNWEEKDLYKDCAEYIGFILQ